MTHPDVAVVGGGIVGLSTAAFLAEAGASVVLYEREAIGAGASGRNSGVVQHPFDPALVPLYHETVREYRRLADELPDAGFRLPEAPAGLLLVSEDPGLVRSLAAQLAAELPDLAGEVLEGPGLVDADPALGLDLAACRLPVGFPVVPAAPTYAFATLAERRGVGVRLGREAIPALERSRVIGIRVGGRLEPAGAVVVAAGPWSPALVDPSGAWRPVVARWGVVVETALAHPPRHVLEEAEMDEVISGAAPITTDASAVAADESSPHSSVVTYGDVSAVGSTFLATEPDPAAWTERLLERAVRFVPGLLTAPIHETRACARPVSVDGRPLIGAVAGVSGLFICSGHGPWGISTGPGSARRLADVVMGRGASNASELDPARFGAPPVA